MHLGFSLFTDIVLEKKESEQRANWPAHFLDPNLIFDCLKNEGIEYIELKLPAAISDTEITRVIDRVVDAGFHFTFHAPGSIDFPEKQDQYISMLQRVAQISENYLTQPILFIIHGLSGSNISKSELLKCNSVFLTCVFHELENTKVTFAFEILRDVLHNGKIRTGTTYQEVVDILKPIANCKFGVCWDFGHSYAQAEHGIHEKMPPVEFLSLVKHTHIHDYQDDVTHLPLGHGQVPYQIYIQKLLESNFDGIFNLELNPQRIQDPENFQLYVIQSVRLLKLALNNVASII